MWGSVTWSWWSFPFPPLVSPHKVRDGAKGGLGMPHLSPRRGPSHFHCSDEAPNRVKTRPKASRRLWAVLSGATIPKVPCVCLGAKGKLQLFSLQPEEKNSFMCIIYFELCLPQAAHPWQFPSPPSSSQRQRCLQEGGRGREGLRRDATHVRI